MSPHSELFDISRRLEAAADAEERKAAEPSLTALADSASEAGRAFSGSWLGYHSRIYYKDLAPPPPGARFSQEWGFLDTSFTSLGSRGDWQEFEPQQLENYLRERAGNPDLTAVKHAADTAETEFKSCKSEICSILMTENEGGSDTFLKQLLEELEELEPLSATAIANIWAPKGQVISRDMTAIGQGSKIPPHIQVSAQVASIRQAFNVCCEAAELAKKAASHLERKIRRVRSDSRVGTNIFIGHGRSLIWREVKDFVQERLHLPWDEFNRVPVAGVTNQARLAEMLDAAAIAFVIMTAEDETAEGKMQARMNVIHEVGLFQGRLGFTKAIVLLEDGCEDFSNIHGLGQIRFPQGNVAACFEELRRVVEREGLIS